MFAVCFVLWVWVFAVFCVGGCVKVCAAYVCGVFCVGRCAIPSVCVCGCVCGCMCSAFVFCARKAELGLKSARKHEKRGF